MKIQISAVVKDGKEDGTQLLMLDKKASQTLLQMVEFASSENKKKKLFKEIYKTFCTNFQCF